MDSYQKNHSHPLRLLLVEDDDNHAEIVRRTLKSCPHISELDWVVDGEEALKFLQKIPPFAGAIIPDIILLDLKLPKKSGFEVIAEIRGVVGLAKIPIVILSTSDASSDISRAYELNINSYLVKPIDAEKFKQMIEDFCRYWLVWNMSPLV